MTRREADSEIARLVHEMERVDSAIAEHLHTLHGGVKDPDPRGSSSLTPTYARDQIKAWCVAHRAKYDPEVLASTIMAVDMMSRRELAALLRGLAMLLRDSRRRPAA